MWKCDNCGEEITKDKYKVCWNCGTAKPDVQKDVKKTVERIPPKLSSAPKRDIPPIVKSPVTVKPAQEIKPLAKAEILPETELPPKVETPPTPPKSPQPEQQFLPQYDSVAGERPPSIIGKIISVFLWLAAVGAVGYFAYISYQKTAAFEQKIAADFQSFNAQKANFVFPPIPQLRRGTVIEGNVKPKVLPLDVKTGETETLFNYLPDDLRPANIDEVKTMMWLACENTAVGKYRDGTTGFQEKCTVYLVERETNKFIGIQDFLGIMPSLAREKAGEDAIGKVMSEKYVNYLREKQPEAERGLLPTASDSPNHHIYNKSEFIYAVLLLGLLTAIGLGWLAFNLKSSKEKAKKFI
jgi:hypothetical protein